MIKCLNLILICDAAIKIKWRATLLNLSYALICFSQNEHKRWSVKLKPCLHGHQGTSLFHVRYRVCNLVQSSTDVDGSIYRVHDLFACQHVLSPV